MNAQIGKTTTDSKVSDFIKMVNSYTSGQRVDQGKIKSLYNEINCVLTETQAEALNIDFAASRENTCGSSDFPRTQTVTDAGFKKYAESVEKYLSYKDKH